MRLRLLVLATVFALLVALAGCGDDAANDQGGDRAAEQDDAAKERRERMRERRERARIRRERAEARRARERRQARAAARRERRQEAQAAAEQQAAEEQASESCHPSYDPCLDPNASDYDCAGGSGDGPEYTGPVRVTGPDEYDLDADGDGTACES